MFLQPAALWLLGSIAILLWLRFRRRPRRIVRVSSLALWRRPAASSKPRLLLRALTDPLLLLQIAFLTAVVLALARPAFWQPSSRGRTIVLVLDVSASMGALEGGGTRLELARAEARAVLERLPARDRVQLVVAGRMPRIASEPSSDRSEVRGRMAALEPTAAAADLSTATLLALTSTDASRGDLVYVFSDGAANARLPSELWLPRLRYVQVGASSDNVAITRLAPRPSRVSPYDHDLLVEVVNYSKRAREVPLKVTAGGQLVLAETARLAAGERRGFWTEGLSAARATLEASLESPDALAADNRAWAVLGGSAGYSVLLVSRGSRFLEQALTLDPLVRLSRLDPRAYSEAAAAAFDVVVFAGVRPESTAARPRLVFRTARAPGSRRTAELRVPAASRHHPMAGWFEAAGPAWARAEVVTAEARQRVLLEAAGRPVMLASEREPRELIIGLDPIDPSWTRAASFPVFVANAVRWLAASSADLPPQLAAGEILDWRLPELAAGSTVEVLDPEGARTQVALQGDRLIFPRADRPGVYSVRADGLERRFAVNAASAEESDIGPVWFGPDSVTAPTRRAAAAPERAEARPLLSRWLLLAALGLLASEWLLWRRGRSAATPAE